jgi:butyryl-CoA dehydrogenase
MILSEQQIQIRDMARDFARERLAPGAAQRDISHAFPKGELKEMGELGFLGMLVPEAYGGSETGTVPMRSRLRKLPLATVPARPS